MRTKKMTIRLLFTAGLLTGLGASHPATAQSLLLVPESSTHKVYAFNALDGSLVSNNFIPTDAHLKTPKKAIDSGHGSLLISDTGANAIFEYSYSGAYVRTVASVTSPGGVAVRNGTIYVPVGGLAGPNTVQEFGYDGSSLGTFSSDSHLANPFDIIFRSNDVLITDSKTNSIDSYDFSGNYLSTFSAGIKAPQQISQEANGNLLVAGFSNPAGVYEYNAAGVGSRILSNFPRGVYRLGNGNLISTIGISVAVYDKTTFVPTTVATLSGGSFQYVTAVTAVPEPGSVALLCTSLSSIGLLALRRKLRRE